MAIAPYSPLSTRIGRVAYVELSFHLLRSMCTDAKRPPDSAHPLIHQLWQAFQTHDAFKNLLAQPATLRAIMNTVAVRRWLFEEITRHTNGSDAATRSHQRLIQMMEASTMIRGKGYISDAIYTEAYARTWEWFINNLSSYDPEKASFVHWFNKKLVWCIKDVIREQAKKLKRERPILDDHPEPPAKERDRWQDTVENWINTVEQNGTEFCQCRMQGDYAHINCRDLLLRILRAMLADTFTIDEVDWEHLARGHDIAPASLKRFCQTRCFRTFKDLV